jgi:DNA-binding helix-hairpin-helix protein with protein kinase domain
MSVVKIHATLPGISEKITVEEKPFKSGGEGALYFSRCGNYVIKKYHNLPSDKEKHLLKILEIGQKLSQEEDKVFAWPKAIGDTDGKLSVVLPRISSPPYQELLDFTHSPKFFAAQVRRGHSWGNYFSMARQLARVIGILHRKGCAHTDISHRNFLGNIKDGSIVMIDMDGLVVEGWLPPGVDGTFGFMAPEIVMGQGVPNERTDRHSLAILIYYTLLFRNPLQPLITLDEDDERDQVLSWGTKALFSEHPDDRSNRPGYLGVPLLKGGALSYKILTPALQRLGEQAFLTGLFKAEHRPLVEEWEQALAVAIDQLWFCTQCKQPFIYASWLKPVGRRSCPFCGQRIQAPYPVVVEIYEHKRATDWRPLIPEHRLVLGHGTYIYRDMTEIHQYPPPDRSKREKIGHVVWDKNQQRFYLFNDDGGRWQAGPPDNPRQYLAQRGESLPLIPGHCIYVGTERLLNVLE